MLGTRILPECQPRTTSVSKCVTKYYILDLRVRALALDGLRRTQPLKPFTILHKKSKEHSKTTAAAPAAAAVSVY